MNNANLKKWLENQPKAEPTAEEKATIAQYKQDKAQGTLELEDYQPKVYSGKIVLRMPSELHEELAKAAKENNVSLNQYLIYKLAK